MSDTTQPRLVLSADSLAGDSVVNLDGEDMGHIKDLMIDVYHGTVAYAVVSFGGFLGLGDKLFAIPFGALTIDQKNKRFILDLDRDRLEKAPGFDKNEWPDMSLTDYRNDLYEYYQVEPYWQ